MNNPILPLQMGNEPAGRRRPGRPKGSANKRSGDLQRYIEAQYGGLTPGQQSAQLGLVTAAELRDAKGDLVMAMAAKASKLARLLGCEARDAWILMQKERADLLPYIHQKLPTKPEEPTTTQPVTFVAVPVDTMTAADGGAALGEWDTPPDMLQNQALIEGDAEEVTQDKSPNQP